jgi:hypothetical protein
VLVTAAGEQIADMLCRGDMLRGYLSLCIREKRMKRGDYPLGLITDMATAHYGCRHRKCIQPGVLDGHFCAGVMGRCCSSHPVNSCCPSVLHLTAVGLCMHAVTLLLMRKGVWEADAVIRHVCSCILDHLCLGRHGCLLLRAWSALRTVLSFISFTHLSCSRTAGSWLLRLCTFLLAVFATVGRFTLLEHPLYCSVGSAWGFPLTG